MGNIIIFGSEGFTGKYLVETLVKKSYNCINVDLIDQVSNNYYQCDIRNKDEFSNIPISSDDIVVHLAAVQYHSNVPSRNNRKKYFLETNFEGTNNILEWMLNANCRKMIYFSSDMVYGKPQELPVNEYHLRNPFGNYGFSKKSTENQCLEFINKYNFNITIFRPRLIMGPGRLGILKKLFKLIKFNMPVPLIGNGNNCYQMISVYDCVQAIVKTIEHNVPNSIMNLGSSNPPSVKELLNQLINSVNSKSFTIPMPAWPIKKILDVMDKSGLSLMYPEQYMIADENYLLDITKAKDDINWIPEYSDQDMLFQAYNHFIKE